MFTAANFLSYVFEVFMAVAKKKGSDVGRAPENSAPYVRFSRSGVYVDLERYFGTDAGKAKWDRVLAEGQRLMGQNKKSSNKG